MPISAVDAISPAFEHTKQQLFQPFNFGQWTKLAFVGMLAGELGSGGCNFRGIFPVQPDHTKHFVDANLGVANPGLFAALIAILVVTGLMVGLFLVYASSIMRFVLFDSVLTKECHIGREWVARQGPGLKYFFFKLLCMLLSIAALAVLIGIPAAIGFAVGWLKAPRDHVVPLVLSGIVLFFAVMLLIIAFAVFYLLTKDFVVPQMALENLTVAEGWRRLWPMMEAERGGYAAYVGMKIVLAVGAAVAVGIVSVVVTVLMAIPVGALGLAAVFSGRAAGLTWNVETITVAVVAGAVVLVIFLYVLSLISVPVIVFFPAYSIYFFASRYPALGSVLYPVPPVLPLAPALSHSMEPAG